MSKHPAGAWPKPQKGWRSGFCNRRNPADSHARCAGELTSEIPCVCDCHTPQTTSPGSSAPTLDEPPALTRRDRLAVSGTGTDPGEVPNGCRQVTEQAVEVLDAGAYLSPEWYEARRTSVSASEIAAILGLSPWQSAFDLWWLKRTGSSSEGETKELRRGRRFEALILEDFAEEHPEFYVAPVGLVRNIERPWQACTPDGLAYDGEEPPWGEWSDHTPVGAIEAKTAGSRDGWGQAGTDDIPVYYRTQVLWQMDTLGLNVAYVPVRFGWDYAEYVVEYDEVDAALMREAAEAFLSSVREDRMPEVDSHKATTRRLKRLHPDLTDDEAEVPATVLRQYQRAKRLRNAAQDRIRLAENRIRAALGSSARGTVDGRKVLTRSIYEVAEHTRKASTTDRINFPRKELS